MQRNWKLDYHRERTCSYLKKLQFKKKRLEFYKYVKQLRVDQMYGDSIANLVAA
jgi:hypothetical protein